MSTAGPKRCSNTWDAESEKVWDTEARSETSDELIEAGSMTFSE